ncbi:HopJ type III effector protein [Flavobacterium jejuense]|uniref:HopJ type III effector protein n=1 Tax=Flavobacterium jejuense TaxID=1544455 RepID=A0ABX0IWB7_9FLAO|nr:HopJ type III effector protein [Flavobacterium jejuense]NHN28112.1 HopJ type III effector protein [Flavobacterium jejuense]
MTILALINKVKQSESIVFSEVIETIDANYTFVPTYFKNGEVVNEANENNGSCKVFSFAKMHNLNAKETVFLFGEHYQKVVETPNEKDHQNIRNFLKFGWEGVVFEKEALL